MKTVTMYCCLLMTLILSHCCFAQQAVEFERDFEILAATKFDTADIDKMSEKYFPFLSPFNPVTQLGMRVKGEQWVRFPLEAFKQKEIYKKEIAGLITSPSPKKRLLGYLTSAAAGDTSQRRLLKARLEEEEEPGCSLMLGMSLMHLGWSNTSQLFRWMVKNNGEAGGFLFPMFMSLPVDSLRETAYQFSQSDDWNERIFAIQTFMRTGYTVRTDSILRRAILEWPLSVKGYAILPAQSIRMANLHPLLEHLLDSAATRRVALAALSDSPTDADRVFMRKLATKSLDAEMLDGFKSSRYSEMVKYWLTQLQSDKLPANYWFSVQQDSLLKTDELLPFVHASVGAIRNPEVLASLLPALAGRKDAVSQQILTGMITHDNNRVRDGAGNALTGTCPENLKSIISAGFLSAGKYPFNVFQLAIGCGLDSLQQSAEEVYNAPVEGLMQVNALTYLATYPGKNSLKLFREVIHQQEDDTMLKRVAATGLGKLKDSQSVGKIIELSEAERAGSDANCAMYITALADMGGDRCKEYISSFLKSESKYIADMSAEIIKRWPGK